LIRLSIFRDARKSGAVSIVRPVAGLRRASGRVATRTAVTAAASMQRETVSLTVIAVRPVRR